MTHLPFHSWCPRCVNDKATDRSHKKSENQGENNGLDIVFDGRFVGGMDDEETLVVQVAGDRKTRLWFAHVVLRRQGVTCEPVVVLEKDCEKLVCTDVFLDK